jgi:hypothetical protein
VQNSGKAGRRKRAEDGKDDGGGDREQKIDETDQGGPGCMVHTGSLHDAARGKKIPDQLLLIRDVPNYP